MRKGILFTITTSILLIAMFNLVSNFSDRTSKERSYTASLDLGDRAGHAWEDVTEEIIWIIELNVSKNGKNVTFYDHLPATYDIGKFLSEFGEFIKKYYETPDLDMKFISPTGKEIQLDEIEPVVKIKPFGINYSYPDFGKNRLHIRCPAENLSAIKCIDIFFKLENTYFKCNITAEEGDPDRCNVWAPDNRVPSCENLTYCVNATITVEDAENVTYVFPDHFFNIEGTKKSVNDLDIKNVTANFKITTQFGPISDDLVVDINLHNTLVSSRVTMCLNTTEFYIDFLSKFLVNSSNYGVYKIDWMS